MSILINKDTKVITQGITGKTGQFHTRMCREYANGKNAFVAGVNPKKAGEDFEGIPIYGSVKDAKEQTGATVSVIYVPPAGAAAAIWEAVEADLDLAICITEGIPVRDMIEVKDRMRREGNMKKPVVGFIAGVTAPPGKRMGHAGALISGGADTAEAKLAIMDACGIKVTKNPSEMGRLLKSVL
jgi:succinyl-CoA synthetase alpha subunit